MPLASRRLALLRPGRLVRTSFRWVRLVQTSSRASVLSLSSPLELPLRVFLLEREFERLLEDLRQVRDERRELQGPWSALEPSPGRALHTLGSPVLTLIVRTLSLAH